MHIEDENELTVANDAENTFDEHYNDNNIILW